MRDLGLVAMAPPRDSEAEVSLVVSLLIEDKGQTRRITQASRVVGPTDFLDERPRYIFEAVSALKEQEVPVNQITVAYRLAQGKTPTGRTLLEEIGGQAWLSDAIRDLISPDAVEHFAQRVRAAAVKRRVFLRSVRLATAAAGEEDVTHALSDAIADLSELRLGMHSNEGRLFVFADELETTVPPRQWVVDGVLELDSVAEVYGPTGALKTFTMLDIACCVATGVSWHGRAVIPGVVVYIMAEGIRAAQSRIWAWEQSNGCRVHDVALVPRNMELLDDAEITRLLSRIELELPARPVLIVADTLNRALAGKDENSPGDMGRLLRNIDILRRATGATIVLVHHPGKDGSNRGHSSMPAAMTAIIKVTRTSELVTLRCEKQKDDAPFEPITLRAVEYLTGAGRSLALEDAKSRQLQMVAEAALSPGAQDALSVLAGGGVSGLAYTEWKRATERPESTFNRQRAELEEAGMVEKQGGRWRATSATSTELP